MPTPNAPAPDNIGHGGNIIFSPGAADDKQRRFGATDGSFIFRDAEQVERLRIDPGGKFFVNGEPVETDSDVYVGFTEWLKNAHWTPPGG